MKTNSNAQTTAMPDVHPSLIVKHRKTLEWLSAAVLWKRELSFFQKLLDRHAGSFADVEGKKQLDHFQNIIIYYNGELIDALSKRLRLHEKKLAEIIEANDACRTDYMAEHSAIMQEAESLNHQLLQYKEELFTFIEKVI